MAADARLTGGTTSTGRRAVVEAGMAIVEGSVVFDGMPLIGNRRALVSVTAIVGYGATIAAATTTVGGAAVRAAEIDGVVIGDGAYVGPGNELLRGLRLWPGTRLEATSVRFSSDA